MRWSDIQREPSPPMLRQFAVLSLIFFGGIGGYRLLRGDQGVLPIVFVSLGMLLAIGGFASPRLLKPVFVGWMMLVFPIGWLVSHAILTIIFFGVFAPMGWILRLCGHDPLLLRKPKTDSYWIVKEQQRDPSRYLKQF